MFATCSVNGVLDGDVGETGANIWSGSNSGWRPIMCTNSANREAWGNQSGPSSNCLKFQVNPTWNFGCDPSRGQSAHAGGMQVALGDGSIHFIGGSIDGVLWANLCNPADGQVVSLP